MRCSNTTCGAEGTGKFCQECGQKMLENPQTKTTVICTGKRKDGSPCQSELVPGQLFCMYCGTEVDQTLFIIDPEYCSSCKSLLIPGKRFCADCGQEALQLSHEVSSTKTIRKLENGHSIGNENKPALSTEANTVETGDVGNSYATGNIYRPELNTREKAVEITGDTRVIKPKNESAGRSHEERNTFISNNEDCLFKQKDEASLYGVNDQRTLETQENKDGIANASDYNIRRALLTDDARSNEDEAQSELGEKLNPDLEMDAERMARVVNEEDDKSKNDFSAKTGIMYKKPYEGNLNNIKENAELHEHVHQKSESSDAEMDSTTDDSEHKVGDADSKSDNEDLERENTQTKGIKKTEKKKEKKRERQR